LLLLFTFQEELPIQQYVSPSPIELVSEREFSLVLIVIYLSDPSLLFFSLQSFSLDLIYLPSLIQRLSFFLQFLTLLLPQLPTLISLSSLAPSI
jgi:hypothetical protein